MAVKKSELYSSLWESCNQLRGGMDASQYKDYVLVVLFLKYISDKAKADKDAMDAAIADGEIREEALAQYLTDENFQSWYTEFCHSLEQD